MYEENIPRGADGYEARTHYHQECGNLAFAGPAYPGCHGPAIEAAREALARTIARGERLLDIGRWSTGLPLTQREYLTIRESLDAARSML